MVIRSIFHLLKLDINQIKRVARALTDLQLGRLKLPTLGQDLETKSQGLGIYAGVFPNPYADLLGALARILVQLLMNRLQNRIRNTHFMHGRVPHLTNPGGSFGRQKIPPQINDTR
jgi:hypothetical protein